MRSRVFLVEGAGCLSLAVAERTRRTRGTNAQHVSDPQCRSSFIDPGVGALANAENRCHEVDNVSTFHELPVVTLHPGHSYLHGPAQRCLMELASASAGHEPFVDAQRAATFLAMRRKTLLNYARMGKLPGHPLGDGVRKTWRFRLSELEYWMQSEVNSGQRLRSCSRRIS